MSTRPEVTATTDDALRREVWRFYYDEHLHALVLQEYRQEKRQTTRHKFQAEAFFAIGYRSTLPRPSVVPESVQREAAKQFKDSLRVLVERG